MKLGEIDINLKPHDIKLFLCKPDRTVIYPLKDIYGANFSEKLGQISELSFTIPTMIERNHELINNPLIDKIKPRYLVKLEYNNVTEYLVFLEENKTYSKNDESIDYMLYGEGYLLADKHIREHEFVSENLTYMISAVLETSVWTVGYVDGYIDTLFRSHNITSQTALQSVLEIAEKFNAIIVWDTLNFKINFYQPQNIELNTGLKFKENKFLESFNVSTHSREIVTRLKVYGSEGLSIRKLTPTGTNYLEDFSWFMYPFERDFAGNVISQSEYMSDSLCIALEDYTELLARNGSQFEVLTSSLKLRQDTVQQLEQQYSDLSTEYIQIMDELDIINADDKDGTPEHTLVVQRRLDKESEMASKTSEVDAAYNAVLAIQLAIQSLASALAIENNLSADNMIELNKHYVVEKEYTNDTVVDEEDLLAEGIKAFNEFREPSFTMSMNIENFLSNVESQHDWNKIRLGDIVKLESKRLRVGIQAKIIERRFDFDNDSIDLVIANEKDLKDDFAKMLADIYSANQTSTSYNMNKFKYDMIEETNSVVNQLYNGGINTIKNSITGGYNQSITIDERGFQARSLVDPLSWLVIQNGFLAITNDKGNSWKHAISKDGIYGDKIFGRIIMGNRLIIEDEKGIIRLSGSLQEIFDANGNQKVLLGEYETGKFGLRVNDGAIDIRTSGTNQRGVQFDVNGIRGFNSSGQETFSIDSQTGMAKLQNNFAVQTTTSSNRGVKMDSNGIRGYNSTGTEMFNLNAITGDAVFRGRLDAVSGTFEYLSSGRIEGAEMIGGSITGTSITSSGTSAQGETTIVAGQFNQNSSNGSISMVDGVLITSGSLGESLRVSGASLALTSRTGSVFKITNWDTPNIDIADGQILEIFGRVRFYGAVEGISAKFG